MKKKLNEQEIEQIINKIRNRYNDLIVTYMLSPRIKNHFEERLYQVKRAGVNPERFFHDEILNIKNIETREREKLNKEAAEKRKIEARKKQNINTVKQDFADRMIEKMMQKIEKYPEIFIHDHANPEIRKLFGTLIDFDSKHWKNYDRISKKYRALKYNLSYIQLENQLNDFSRIYKDDVPTRLIRYKTMLSSPFSRTKDIEKEEKMVILESAVLINNLKKALSEIDDTEHMTTEDFHDISDMKDYLENVKNDFRLNDLMEFTKY